jgi:hypothetical protein
MSGENPELGRIRELANLLTNAIKETVGPMYDTVEIEAGFDKVRLEEHYEGVNEFTDELVPKVTIKLSNVGPSGRLWEDGDKKR